jgi:hypothetical protein
MGEVLPGGQGRGLMTTPPSGLRPATSPASGEDFLNSSSPFMGEVLPGGQGRGLMTTPPPGHLPDQRGDFSKAPRRANI